jgi:predicted membrane-bound dolichyl-phosphate-mannose-protein mannosyltransferase
MSNKYDKFVTKALDKMFTYVGFERWDKAFTEQEQWYTKKTWTQEQSDDFKKWFISEAKTDLKFNKSMAEKEYGWFDLRWGWKIQS